MANRGDEKYAVKLKGPECPPEIQYLVNWSYMLFGRSGLGFGSVAPLSFQEVESWCSLTGNRLAPYELDGLMVLDSVLRDPELKDRREEEDPGTPKSKELTVQWPSKKRSDSALSEG